MSRVSASFLCFSRYWVCWYLARQCRQHVLNAEVVNGRGQSLTANTDITALLVLHLV
jgi:hypothetical protein